MAKQLSPDGRLVYLHCSSIFYGANALVRRERKVSQLLEKHKASIKILTKEFTLPAIAAVAKELLEKRVFESLPRAKLRFPELFQTSLTQEAEREASEAEVIRVEAEKAQGIGLKSDEEKENECLNIEQGKLELKSVRILENEAEVEHNVQIDTIESCPQSTSQAPDKLSIPRLHPVYLPFRTQYRILVRVQSLLEECCLEFGNIWVPDLMKARKWHDAESIELTEWIKRFSKYADSLAPSAINPIPGKSISEVLWGTSTLRHSAVHRLSTSAAGISNMLSAAISFVEALNDPKRAEKITKIKTHLEISIEEIVQQQNLLERKLTDQCREIALRRAELDELERSSIEGMLATDEKQRAEVGFAFESFLVRSQQISNPCACRHASNFDGAKADSEAEENMENGMKHEPSFLEEINDVQNYDRSPLSEEKSHQHKNSEKDEKMPRHNNTGADLGDEPAVPEALIALMNENLTLENVFFDSVHASLDTSPESPQYGVWNLDDATRVLAKPHNAAERAIPAEEPYLAILEETSLSTETYINASTKELLSEKALFTKEVIPKAVSVEMVEVITEATPETSQAELTSESFYDAPGEPQSFNELNLCQEATVPCDEPAICEEDAALCCVPALGEAAIAPYDESASCQAAIAPYDESASCEAAIAPYDESASFEAAAVSCDEPTMEKTSRKAKKEKKRNKERKEMNKKAEIDKKVRRIESDAKLVIEANIATEPEPLRELVPKTGSNIGPEKSRDMLKQILLCLEGNNMTDRDKCEIIERVIKS